MATQLLIYETAVPVSAARHRDASVEVGADYAFASNVNSVPLMAVEFPHAAPEYPVVFAGAGEEVMPAVILGMRGNENLYLAHGKWSAKYIPAFVRRYPFVFSTLDEGKSFVLCVDEAFAGFNRQGRGQRLFGEELAELAKTDELELLYVHVQSMRNFNVLRERLVVVEGGKAEAAPVAEAAAKAKAPGGKPARRAAGD